MRFVFFKSRARWTSLLVVLSLALLTTAGLWKLLAEDLTGPKAGDRGVTLRVVDLMSSDHLSKHRLDDEISQRALKAYIESLDPMKVYFYQSDIDEFQQFRTDIDDRTRRGDISPAYVIFRRFLQRVNERVATVDDLLKQRHDFTADEEMVRDPDVATFPKTPAQALDRWRKRIKYDLLVLKGDKTVGPKAVEKLSRRYHSFAKRMGQTSSDELLEKYLTSVTSSYDPHTTYMSPSTLENFQIMMRLNLDGIGAALQMEDGYTTVSKIIPGGAADKHGKLKPKDQIVSVGQESQGEMEDVVDMKLGDVVKLIRGRRGTIVRLGVIPVGSNETAVYKITRARIELKDSEARYVIIESGKRRDGTPMRLGVIDLPSFYMDMEAARRNLPDYKSTTRDMRKILDYFKSKQVDGVVLDLRRNGGGSLTEAIRSTGLFIDYGPVVQVKDQVGNVEHYDDDDREMVWRGPLVVVTSKLSASASEILAGAIKDYNRGIIVGDKATHGKGTVQSLVDLGSQIARIPNPPNLGALKLTMQQFYRPNGDSTQQRGVLADVTLPALTNHMDIGESDLDFAIQFDKVRPTRYFDYGMTSPKIVQRLGELSESRRRDSTDFQKLTRRIEQYRQQKARTHVSLNEEKFFARRKELNAEKEEEKQFDESSNKDVFPRTYYNNEILSISVDYIHSLGNRKVAVAR